MDAPASLHLGPSPQCKPWSWAHTNHAHCLQIFGMMFNFGLMGSLVVQVYRYYCTFPNDRNIAKAIVYTLFLAELAETAAMSYSAERIYGAGFGNTAVLNDSGLTYIPVVVLPTTIGLIVQLFYAYRVLSFSRSKIAAGVILLLALVTFMSGITDAVMSARDGQLSHVSHRRSTITVWLVSGALCDSAIATAMVFHLKRGLVVSTPMKNNISRIIRYTIGTGALTACISLLQIFITFAFPTQNYFEVMGWVIGKLYSNSLMVLLNARATIIGGRDDARRMEDIEWPADFTLTVITESLSVGEWGAASWSYHSASESSSPTPVSSSNGYELNCDVPRQPRWQTPPLSAATLV